MKTSIDTADPLFAEARRATEREGTTLKALVTQGLRQVLAAQAGEREPFRLRPASCNGLGLRRELQEASWDRLRELAYEGHGRLSRWTVNPLVLPPSG